MIGVRYKNDEVSIIMALAQLHHTLGHIAKPEVAYYFHYLVQQDAIRTRDSIHARRAAIASI